MAAKVCCRAVPGCSVESTTFFACHISGVMNLASPCLYDETSLFAFSSPDEETKRVLCPQYQLLCCSSRSYCGIPTTPGFGEAAPFFSSPRICNLGRLSHTAPIGIEVVLRRGKVPVPWKGSGHSVRIGATACIGGCGGACPGPKCRAI